MSGKVSQYVEIDSDEKESINIKMSNLVKSVYTGGAVVTLDGPALCSSRALLRVGVKPRDIYVIEHNPEFYQTAITGRVARRSGLIRTKSSDASGFRHLSSIDDIDDINIIHDDFFNFLDHFDRKIDALFVDLMTASITADQLAILARTVTRCLIKRVFITLTARGQDPFQTRLKGVTESSFGAVMAGLEEVYGYQRDAKSQVMCFLSFIPHACETRWRPAEIVDQTADHVLVRWYCAPRDQKRYRNYLDDPNLTWEPISPVFESVRGFKFA
jgi:phospholipid N-methyltransferase